MNVVYLTVFIDLLGFGLIIPLLPYYAQSFGATGLMLGALTTAYSGAQFLGAPIIGTLSDRYGRRPILLITILGSAISMALAGWASTFAGLLLARLAGGLCGGSIAAAQAYIADVTTPETRAKHMGMIGAAIGLGFVLGPALGASLADYGFGAAAFAAAGLAIINFVWALLKLPESRTPSGGTESQTFSIGVVLKALRRRAIRPILGATFLTTMGFVAMETTYPLLGSVYFAMDAKDLGKIFTLIGVIMVIVQGGLLGRIVKKWGEPKVALAGMIINAAALIALPTAAKLGPSILLLGCLALGQALSSPTLSSLLSKSTAADAQGTTLGLGQSVGAAARTIGPLAAGWLYDGGPAGPYIWGGILAILGAVWLGAHRTPVATSAS